MACVAERQMHDHIGDTRSQTPYFVGVKLGPVLWSNRRLNAYRSIEHNVIGAEQRRHEGCPGKPLLGNSERQLVFARHSQQRLEQSLVLVKRSHVRIEMRRLNTKRPGPRDLGPNLRFDFLDIHVRGRLVFQRV